MNSPSHASSGPPSPERTQSTGSLSHRLIEEYRSYALALANDLCKVAPSGVDRNEVHSAAEFGLVQAAERYKPNNGVTFATFAYYRIRGAVYDVLRGASRRFRFEVAATRYLDDYATGRIDDFNDPTAEEASMLSRGVMTCYVLAEHTQVFRTGPTGQTPEQRILDEELLGQLRGAMASLPPRNRQVIEDYYMNDLTFEQIGEKLGLSKSWVSRMHARSIDLIREQWRVSNNGPKEHLPNDATSSSRIR